MSQLGGGGWWGCGLAKSVPNFPVKSKLIDSQKPEEENHDPGKNCNLSTWTMS